MRDRCDLRSGEEENKFGESGRHGNRGRKFVGGSQEATMTGERDSGGESIVGKGEKRWWPGPRRLF